MKRQSAARVRLGGKIVVLVVIAWAFGPVGVSAAPVASVSPNQTTSELRVQLTAEPVSLDPARVEDGAALRVVANVHDGLVGYDGAGNRVFRLASAVTRSSDGRVYTFELRSNARWSDGSPILAEEIVAGMRRVLSREVGSPLAHYLFEVEGASAFHAGQGAWEQVAIRALRSSPAAPRADRLEIRLVRPVSYFLDALTLPLSAPYTDRVGADGHALASGPYRITQVQPTQRIVLEANPHYALGKPAIERVTLVVLTDESAALNVFESGRLDVLARIPQLELARVRKRAASGGADYALVEEPFLATYYLAFDVRQAPASDRAWRQAFSQSIRRAELVRLLQAGERPATSWIPFGILGSRPFHELTPPRPLAPESAPVEIAFDAGARNQLIVEKILSDIEKTLGKRFRLQGRDWKTHVQLLKSSPPPVFRFGRLAPFRDAISHLQAFVSGDPNNFSRYSNPEYDALVRQISEAPLEPVAARRALIERADRLLVEDDAVVVPIYHYVQAHLVRRRVEGFRANPFGVVRWDELRLKPGAK